MSDLLWGRTPVVRRKKLQSTSTTSQKLHIYIYMYASYMPKNTDPPPNSTRKTSQDCAVASTRRPTADPTPNIRPSAQLAPRRPPGSPSKPGASGLEPLSSAGFESNRTGFDGFAQHRSPVLYPPTIMVDKPWPPGTGFFHQQGIVHFHVLFQCIKMLIHASF